MWNVSLSRKGIGALPLILILAAVFAAAFLLYRNWESGIAAKKTAGGTASAPGQGPGGLNMARIAATQMLDSLDGKRPPRIVNPEVWPVYVQRFEQAFGVRPA